MEMTLGNTFFREMMEIKPYYSKRLSSWDVTGGNQDCIKIGPGETAVLADIKGSGCIKHIYFTAGDFADRPFMRKVLIRMYWDDEKEPSVEVPIADFFGLGHCAKRYFTSLLITVNPGIYFEGSPGFSAYFPMPFSKRAINPFVNHFGRAPEMLIDVAVKFGGYKADYGDVSVNINAFNHVPIIFALWRGDEELAPNGNILFDANISDYLSTEDVTVLCETIAWKLVKGIPST